MPADENGDKWACEPCIRGHRSTRCEHWDRFMLRVKRPGRPLSSCPHPKNQCTCVQERVMMVRIPKASSCICAPAYSLGPDGFPIVSSTPYTPPSSYSQGPQLNNAYRVQKQSQRPLSIVDPLSIARGIQAELQPPSPFNPPPANSVSNVQPLQQGSAHSVGIQAPDLHEGNDTDRRSLQDRPQVAHPSHMHGAYGSDTTPKANNMFGNGQTPQGWHTPPEDSPNESLIYAPRCTKTSSLLQPRGDGRTGYQAEQLLENSDPSGRSKNDITTDFNKNLDWSNIDNVSMINLAPNTDVHDSNGFKSMSNPQPYSNVSNFTLHTLPSSYATASHPLNPKQFAELQQASRRNTPSSHLYAPSESGVSLEGAKDHTFLSLPTHNCNCGDGCRCLGCAAHPYNTTTKNHVQDLGEILAHRQDGTEPESPVDPLHRQSMTPVDIHQMFLGIDLGLRPAAHADSPRPDVQQSQIPTNPEASLAFTQADLTNPLYTSDSYYTMEYPLTDFFTCTNSSGTCQCGDDCGCIGCLTHVGHNGESLDNSILGGILEAPVAEKDAQGGADEDTPAPSSCCR